MAVRNTTWPDRKAYPRISDWPTFLERWAQAVYREEIIGLLYGGPSVPISSEGGFDAEIPVRIDWYISVAQSADQLIAVKAQQVIVNRFVLLVEAGQAAAQQQLLEFLSFTWKGLWGEPYPRIIQRYLQVLFDGQIKRGGSMLADNEAGAQRLVRCLMVWGMAGYLNKPDYLDRFADTIRAYCAERFICADDAIDTLFCDGKIPEELGSASIRERIDGFAARLLWSLERYEAHKATPATVTA